MAGRRPHVLEALDEALFDIRRLFQRSSYRKRLLRGLSYEVELATLRLLRAVQRSDHPPSVGEVAELLTIAPSTASRLVDQAAESGYVKRLPGADDRRRTLLELTSPGRRVLDELNMRRREMLGEATHLWQEAELEQLTRLLSALHADFDRLKDPT